MEKELIPFIKSYLYETFGINKVKSRKKFKRGIVMELGRVVYVENGRLFIRNSVFDHLKDIFNVEDDIINQAMGEYLTETTIKKKGRPTKRRPSRTSV